MLTVPVMRGDRTISFEDRSYPEPGPGQLLVGNRANALCGSDRQGFVAGSPVVAGHEVAGEVVAAGPDTTTPIGSRGVLYLMVYCGECRSCRGGATNVCLAKEGDIGFTCDGGLGPFTVVEERMFFGIDDDVSFPLATLLLDVMGTSGHALDRAEALRPDISSAYIAGAGPVGLGALVMSKVRYGADFPVYISDISPWRREFAESFGGIAVPVSDVAAISEVDIALDATGRGDARLLAVRRLSQRGVLVCVGHGSDLLLDVSRDLIAKEAAVIGSEYFPYADLYLNAELLRRHRDQIGRVITHQFEVARTGEAFETFFAGETGKVIVTQVDHG